jgi:hypothetical protein
LFTDRFYQEPGGFQRRIRYVADEGVYEEIDPDDAAAQGAHRRTSASTPTISARSAASTSPACATPSPAQIGLRLSSSST